MEHDHDTQGAIIELDINKLDKSELIMLGQKTVLEKFVYGFRLQASELAHEGTANVLREVADIMNADLEKITVKLTKSAIRHKSGTMQNIPRGKGH